MDLEDLGRTIEEKSYDFMLPLAEADSIHLTSKPSSALCNLENGFVFPLDGSGIYYPIHTFAEVKGLDKRPYYEALQGWAAKAEQSCESSLDHLTRVIVQDEQEIAMVKDIACSVENYLNDVGYVDALLLALNPKHPHHEACTALLDEFVVRSAKTIAFDCIWKGCSILSDDLQKDALILRDSPIDLQGLAKHFALLSARARAHAVRSYNSLKHTARVCQEDMAAFDSLKDLVLTHQFGYLA